ncbi:plastid division protein PDV2 [Senna tora]|uniref:Plastid division protein PDV2 n=1 Tax=Senna tora TaxID=362788 RepID=A0A834X8J1_9FABA|nr:plastid division protein PDV2 [Senna tora]
MEDEGIGLVLARVTELRFNISNCIPRAIDVNEAADDEENEAEAEAQRLFDICDTLASLETHLSSLQVLQQQQRYEREVALAEIENYRKMLISKLKEYKGRELEVLQEASLFASETVEHNNDLLLPPYPSRPPCLMCLENDYLSPIPLMHKSVHKGKISNNPMIEARKSPNETEQKNHVQARAKNSRKALGLFITSAAKTVLTVLGVVSILSLSGFVPDLGKLAIHLNGLGLLQQEDNNNKDGRTTTLLCPPGKILVVENGEARCIVKERVEIPFSAVASAPDINYGCG